MPGANLCITLTVKKIVVAEDDTANRDLISEMLRGWGYDVVEARDGADALEKVEQSRPDLVLCDIQMPVLDGVGLVQALRRNHNFATLPVIALTGFGLQDHEAIASAGFNTYQSKPLNSALLKRNVERLLQKGSKDSKAK